MVHSLPQAEAALRAAAGCGAAVIIESPPDAARFWGAPYFAKLIAAARVAAPDAVCEAVLDCGTAPGLALEALRRGVKTVRLRGTKAVVRRVADIAGQMGARVETGPRPAGILDLGAARDPEAAARRYILERMGQTARGSTG
jgi:hypothetical protein